MTTEITFGVAVGAIVAAIINIVWNTRQAKSILLRDREESIKLLAGELLSIIYHFGIFEISSRLLDEDMNGVDEVVRRLKLAKYGDLKVIEKVNLFGFLSAEHIRNLHQLALKIRNADLLIDDFILNQENRSHHNFSEICGRMPYIEDCASLILMYIAENYPEYRELIEETKGMEKPNYLI